MTDLVTEIRLPGTSDAGVADWGQKTVPEMLAYIRNRAKAIKESAEAILAASDDDFRVITYRGVNVQRDRKVLQAGRTL